MLLCHFIIASELQIMALVCHWICAKGLLHLLRVGVFFLSFLSRVENNGFFVAWTLHVKLLQPMSLSENTM